jgi:Ca-activated chloride channel family protein
VVDLQPLDRGADYTLVLDVSGSMQSKIATMAHGVVQALGECGPRITFASSPSTAEPLC